MVSKATAISGNDVAAKAYNIEGDVRIQYFSQPEFERLARQFGIFEEWKVNLSSFQ
jgi:alpha-1,3-mannosyl-glycoprotein beta-1,2-N-acetylglucosaminyltransferase